MALDQLRTFLKSSTNFFRNLLSYPKRLTPKKSYKFIDINGLEDSTILLRRSLLPSNQMFDDLGYLRQESLLENNNIRDWYQYSFNLAGVFRKSDLKYRIESNSSSIKSIDWEENETKVLSRFKYRVFEHFHPIGFSKKDFHEKPFPIIRNSKYTSPLTGTISIQHRPTCGNFWHCQFLIKDENGVDVQKGKSGWQKDSVVHFMRLSLPSLFDTTLSDEIPTIEDRHYRKYLTK